MWPDLIRAGGSLLGGILGRPRQTSARENSRGALMGQAQGARDAAEEYGFNPLTLLGVSSAVGPSESSAYMGSAIADAGMILADGLAKRQDEVGAVSQLEQQNRELQEQVRSLTLRPRVGGVYAQREAVPTTRAALGARGDENPEGVVDSFGVFHPRGNHPAPSDYRLDRGDGIYAGGLYIGSAPGWSPAEVVEQEYGDAVSWLYGAGRIAADARYNLHLYANRRDGRAAQARGEEVWRMSDGQYYQPLPRPPRRNPPTGLSPSALSPPPFSYPPQRWSLDPWAH
ncbi:MAG: hypothetical protein H3C51_04625 [Rubellimicrobium sp.]|nr:hypothetical protein [Rubellimicrobium sp.]